MYVLYYYNKNQKLLKQVKPEKINECNYKLTFSNTLLQKRPTMVFV
jgi:hypothetical protein